MRLCGWELSLKNKIKLDSIPALFVFYSIVCIFVFYDFLMFEIRISCHSSSAITKFNEQDIPFTPSPQKVQMCFFTKPTSQGWLIQPLHWLLLDLEVHIWNPGFISQIIVIKQQLIRFILVKLHKFMPYSKRCLLLYVLEHLRHYPFFI